MNRSLTLVGFTAILMVILLISPAIAQQNGNVNEDRAFAIALNSLFAGDHSGSLEQLELLTKADPDSAVYWHFRAVAEYRLGQRQVAELSKSIAHKLAEKQVWKKRDVARALEKIQGYERIWLIKPAETAFRNDVASGLYNVESNLPPLSHGKFPESRGARIDPIQEEVTGIPEKWEPNVRKNLENKQAELAEIFNGTTPTYTVRWMKDGPLFFFNLPKPTNEAKLKDIVIEAMQSAIEPSNYQADDNWLKQTKLEFKIVPPPPPPPPPPPSTEIPQTTVWSSCVQYEYSFSPMIEGCCCENYGMVFEYHQDARFPRLCNIISIVLRPMRWCR